MQISPPPAAMAPHAATDPGADAGHVVVEPNWVARPTGDDLAAAYPEAALRLQAPGFVLLRCGVAQTGGLTACEAIQEAPAGLGFGAAGLKLASDRFRMTPRTRDGVATPDGVVTIPLNFKTPGAAFGAVGPVILREVKPGEPVVSAQAVLCGASGGPLCVMKPFAWVSTPPAAAMAGLYGAVAVSCRLGAEGAPERCGSAPVSPGAHVEAAVFWARRYRAPPEVDGVSTAGATVRFVILPPGPTG